MPDTDAERPLSASPLAPDGEWGGGHRWLRWALGRLRRTAIILGMCAGVTLILAPELLKPPILPPPMWWWRGLWSTWVGALCVVLPLYALMRGGSALVADEEARLTEQARLSGRGMRRLRLSRLGSLLVDLLPALVVSVMGSSLFVSDAFAEQLRHDPQHTLLDVRMKGIPA